MLKKIDKICTWILDISPFVCAFLAFIMDVANIDKYENRMLLVSVFLYLLRIERNNKLIGISYNVNKVEDIPKKSKPPKSGSGIPRKK